MKEMNVVKITAVRANEKQFAKFVELINAFKFDETDLQEEAAFLGSLKSSLSQETALSSLSKVQFTDDQGFKTVGYIYTFNDDDSFQVYEAEGGTGMGEMMIKEVGEDLVDYIALGYKADSDESVFSYVMSDSISNMQKLAQLEEIAPMTEDDMQTELVLIDILDDLDFDSLC